MLGESGNVSDHTTVAEASEHCSAVTTYFSRSVCSGASRQTETLTLSLAATLLSLATVQIGLPPGQNWTSESRSSTAGSAITPRRAARRADDKSRAPRSFAVDGADEHGTDEQLAFNVPTGRRTWQKACVQVGHSGLDCVHTFAHCGQSGAVPAWEEVMRFVYEKGVRSGTGDAKRLDVPERYLCEEPILKAMLSFISSTSHPARGV